MFESFYADHQVVNVFVIDMMNLLGDVSRLSHTLVLLGGAFKSSYSAFI